MDIKLSITEKKDILVNYGSTMSTINKVEKILLELDIIEDKNELYELLCSIALEAEVMKDMKANESVLARKTISEVIASTLLEKYEDLCDLSDDKRLKLKIFINEHSPIEVQ